jgi:hypothetical protein
VPKKKQTGSSKGDQASTTSAPGSNVVNFPVNEELTPKQRIKIIKAETKRLKKMTPAEWRNEVLGH